MCVQSRVREDLYFALNDAKENKRWERPEDVTKGLGLYSIGDDWHESPWWGGNGGPEHYIEPWQIPQMEQSQGLARLIRTRGGNDGTLGAVLRSHTSMVT